MTRIITGLVLIAIGFLVISKADIYLISFLMIVGTLGLYEGFKMANHSKIVLFLSSILYGSYSLIIYQNVNLTLLNYVLYPLIILFYVISITDFYCNKLFLHQNSYFTFIRFFLYVSIGFSTVYLVRSTDNGLLLVAYLFLVIWATDTMAYFGGKYFGSRSLSKISPKKTIEGTLIGLVSAMIFVAIGCYVFEFSYYFVIGAAIISLFSQLGDLYESLIKRFYNVKDSSNILPGHGGILDRADSTLYVFPIFYLLLGFIN